MLGFPLYWSLLLQDSTVFVHLKNHPVVQGFSKFTIAGFYCSFKWCFICLCVNGKKAKHLINFSLFIQKMSANAGFSAILKFPIAGFYCTLKWDFICLYTNRGKARHLITCLCPLKNVHDYKAFWSSVLQGSTVP